MRRSFLLVGATVLSITMSACGSESQVAPSNISIVTDGPDGLSSGCNAIISAKPNKPLVLKASSRDQVKIVVKQRARDGNWDFLTSRPLAVNPSKGKAELHIDPLPPQFIANGMDDQQVDVDVIAHSTLREADSTKTTIKNCSTTQKA